MKIRVTLVFMFLLLFLLNGIEMKYYHFDACYPLSCTAVTDNLGSTENFNSFPIYIKQAICVDGDYFSVNEEDDDSVDNLMAYKTPNLCSAMTIPPLGNALYGRVDLFMASCISKKYLLYRVFII